MRVVMSYGEVYPALFVEVPEEHGATAYPAYGSFEVAIPDELHAQWRAVMDEKYEIEKKLGAYFTEAKDAYNARGGNHRHDSS